MSDAVIEIPDTEDIRSELLGPLLPNPVLRLQPDEPLVEDTAKSSCPRSAATLAEAFKMDATRSGYLAASE